MFTPFHNSVKWIRNLATESGLKLANPSSSSVFVKIIGLTPERRDSQPREKYVIHEEGRRLAGEPPQQEITDRTENARFSSNVSGEIKFKHAARFSESENPKRYMEGENPNVQASAVPDTPITRLVDTQSGHIDGAT